MDILRDGMDIIGGKVSCRHRRQSRILSPIANYRLKQLAGLITQGDGRAQKVRTALLAAAQVGAMAQAAVKFVQHLSACDERRIPQRTLLCWKPCCGRALGGGATSPAALRIQLERSARQGEKAIANPRDLRSHKYLNPD